MLKSLVYTAQHFKVATVRGRWHNLATKADLAARYSLCRLDPTGYRLGRREPAPQRLASREWMTSSSQSMPFPNSRSGLVENPQVFCSILQARLRGCRYHVVRPWENERMILHLSILDRLINYFVFGNIFVAPKYGEKCCIFYPPLISTYQIVPGRAGGGTFYHRDL